MYLQKYTIYNQNVGGRILLTNSYNFTKAIPKPLKNQLVQQESNIVKATCNTIIIIEVHDVFGDMGNDTFWLTKLSNSIYKTYKFKSSNFTICQQ